MMNHLIFSNTQIGFDHLQERKPCQDYSIAKKMRSYTILAVADGHVSSLYIRSHIGSKLAIKAFEQIAHLYHNQQDNLEKKTEKIKLDFLCQWNEAVLNHHKQHPMTLKETSKLSQEDKYRLLINPYIAYGTTFIGTILYRDKIVFIQIGDGCILTYKNSQDYFVPFYDKSERNVAHLTNSMSQDNAFEHLDIEVTSKENMSSIHLATDGLLVPFSTLDNYANHISNLMYKLYSLQSNELCNKRLKSHLKNIATNLGCGDDLSLAMLIF
jgi:hypothetical protein